MATTDQILIKLLSAISEPRDNKQLIRDFMQALVEAKNLPLAVFWMFPKAFETAMPGFEKEVIAVSSFPNILDGKVPKTDCTSLVRSIEGVGPAFFAYDDPSVFQFRDAIPSHRADMNFLYVEDFGYIQLFLNKKGLSFLGSDRMAFSKEEQPALQMVIKILQQTLVLMSAATIKEPFEEHAQDATNHVVKASAFQNTHQSKILSTVSHEVLNPLNTIKGYTALLSEMTLDPAQTAFLDIIEEKRTQLESIVKKILNNTDLRLKEIEIRKQAFDLNEVFYGLEVKLQGQAQRKGIGFKVEIDERLEYWLLGDKDRFADALFFLVENAVRYSVRGQVTVKAHLQGVAEEKIKLAFYVKESGGAFANLDIDGLLGFFKPVASSAPRSHDIMGMGLSLARHYIERMGGELMFQKDTADGTFFVFELDFEVVNSKPVVKRTGLLIQNAEVTRTIKLLLVDDDPTQLGMNKTLLKDWDLFLAENGKEAIETLKSHPDIDVVLMDVNMPELDGIATTEIIRNKLKSTVPIIAYTGESYQERIDDCRAAGMNDFVSKTDNVVLAIEKALNREDILRPAAELSNKGVLAGYYALVIDQFEKVRQITVKTLQDAGCQVDVSSGFTGAMDLVKNNKYNFVLTDFIGSDSELFKMVKGISNLGLSTQVIAYVADNSPDLHARCKAAGLKGPLLKSYASYRSLAINIFDLLQSKMLVKQPRLYNFKLMDGIDLEVQHEFAELFIKETSKLVNLLLSHLNEGRYDRLTAIAHTLKSSSGQYNIKAVVLDLERIEKYQKFGVSEVEVFFLVNKVYVLLHRAMQEMASDYGLKYPLD